MRLLTGLLVIAICGLVMIMGAEIVWFSGVKAEIAATNPEAYRHWANVPGIEFAARNDAFTAIADSGAKRSDAKVLEAIADVLVVRPVSARYWLSLARVRLASGQSPNNVMNAWQLSVLTGPNEGTVLPWRGLFGLVLWDNAPLEMRNRTIADLGVSLPYMTGGQFKIGRALLARQPKEVRQNIQSLLRAEGTTETQLGKIGLH